VVHDVGPVAFIRHIQGGSDIRISGAISTIAGGGSWDVRNWSCGVWGVGV